MQTTAAPTDPPPRLTDEPPDQLPVRLPDADLTCLCGARLTSSRPQCRKCRARERWHRHNRRHADNQRRTDAYRTTALLMGGAR